MKLYNPFRPHLAQRGDDFAIRKLQVCWHSLTLHWVYADLAIPQCWVSAPQHVLRWCVTKNRALAQDLLEREPLKFHKV